GIISEEKPLWSSGRRLRSSKLHSGLQLLITVACRSAPSVRSFFHRPRGREDVAAVRRTGGSFGSLGLLRSGTSPDGCPGGRSAEMKPDLETPALGPDAPPDAAERLWQRWQQGPRPDLDAFLAEAGPLPAAELSAVLRVDQR